MAEKGLQILVVDDEQDYCEVMAMILEQDGNTVETCNDGIQALEKLSKKTFQVVLTDLMMPKMDGNQLLSEIKNKYSDTDVIMMTAYGTIEKAVEAMRHGAYTYVTKGENPEQLIGEIRRLAEVKKLILENQTLREKLNTGDYLLDSKSPGFQSVIEVAAKAAATNVNVMLLGESGVGKEVMARFIHGHSPRRNENFIDLNCHAIPESVLESELFGHEKGSFTGAEYKRIGRFEDADRGTLFLDEIGDIPMNTQAKLLKVIESKKLYPVGNNAGIDVDFRLITATNKNPDKEIQAGRFREDLYYRISTIVIEIPPLRERREDLPDFIHYFMKKCQREMKRPIHHVEAEVEEYLQNYTYPGNIRELKNIIERLVVLADDGIIRTKHLPGYVPKQNTERECANFNELESVKGSEDRTLRQMRKEVEAKYIQEVIAQEGGNLNRAAEVMGITRRQLGNKMNEFEFK